MSLRTSLISSWMSFQINICVALSVVKEKAMLIRTVSKARLVLPVINLYIISFSYSTPFALLVF